MATPRTKSISTKVTEAEYHEITRRAEPQTVSAWARSLLVGAAQPDPLHFLFLAANGRRYRERMRAPGASRSAAQRWGEDRERHIVQHGPERQRVPKREVPRLKEFATRFLEEHA
jgi:hypothetical protein